MRKDMNSLKLINKGHLQISLEQLAALYQVMISNEDEINSKKIVDLYDKLKKEEIMISFAGHFSAGKSSMINALLGEDILPKSPIPTSANVVKINSGLGVARVFFNNDKSVEYKEPYDIEIIKEYSKDKDSIKRIEISTAKHIIPQGSSIIDTPGIDAADDADRLMTEASLHLVDCLFYVMDYNHVQSEVNLQFLKSLQEKRIPFYVIINQIDKHDETELSFDSFDRSVKQTFDQWKIVPETIYYSSLIDPNANHNQFKEVKETLFKIMRTGKEVYSNIDNAVNQVVNDHRGYLKRQYDDKMTHFFDENRKSESSFEEINEVESKLFDFEKETIALKDDFQVELNNTLKNAYLMPSGIRDKAESFLESQQSGFKIGMFATKRKTAEVKEERLKIFLKQLQENTEAAVEWKLRDKFINLLKQYNITNPTLQNKIQHELATVNLTSESLFEMMKPGAKINGDYVLNYTNEMATTIKTNFRRKANHLWEFIEQAILNKNESEKEIYESELSELLKAKTMKEKREEIQAELDEKLIMLSNQLKSPTPDESIWKLLENKVLEKEKFVNQLDAPKVKRKPMKISNETIKKVEKLKDRDQTQSMDNVLDSIDQAIHEINDLPGFQAIINDLKGKQNRLQNRSYTIALFGAFSAGKSSFANALLGENVLPVSPNPTTAAVNRIRPVTDKYKHGTVVVRLKDFAALKNDLLLLTKKLSPVASTFEGLLQWVQDNAIQKDQQLNKMNQAYLQAMITGYKESKNAIGQTVIIPLSDFAAYVSDETKACFIESLDLYYDCSITKQGITLVDTPGADSVNARHTNVAFEYIKHADAILYVTYYNHALSRADKDFLTQLGRVKEAFQLDKMFFIINAADLATDSEELRLVTNYVQEQLVQLGIRFPRLYPVSSKKSLQNKLEDKDLNKQMRYFETDFYQFIYNDLSVLTVKSTIWDLKRASDAMQHYMESLDLNEQEKIAYKKDLLNKKEKLKQQIATVKTDVYAHQTVQKIEKQLFYVLERLSIRYHDIFKEFFNPTTITESGRKAQMQLRNSLQDLMDYVGYELLQELQAVSLRVEAFIQSQATELYDDLAMNSKYIDENFTLPSIDFMHLETPEYEKAFRSLEIDLFNKALSIFKGTKAFFEKNEKELMKETIFDQLQPFAKQYLEKNRLVMVEVYKNQWQEMTERVKIDAIQSVEKHIDSYLEMIATPVDMKALLQKQEKLKAVISKHNRKEV